MTHLWIFDCRKRCQSDIVRLKWIFHIILRWVLSGQIIGQWGSNAISVLIWRHICGQNCGLTIRYWIRITLTKKLVTLLEHKINSPMNKPLIWLFYKLNIVKTPIRRFMIIIWVPVRHLRQPKIYNHTFAREDVLKPRLNWGWYHLNARYNLYRISVFQLVIFFACWWSNLDFYKIMRVFIPLRQLFTFKLIEKTINMHVGM